MLFNSLTFVVFFLSVFAVHSLPLPWSARKFNLVAASYIFYAAWDPWFTLLLLVATLTNWLAAKLIWMWDGSPSYRRTVLWLVAIVNIGVLCIFKYGNEVLGAWESVANHFGLQYDSARTTILLPVGLSFFTFQSLSYSIDVYRRTIKPAASFLDLALFVSFFPVLLAGPLLRAGAFLPQCAQPQRANINELGLGAGLMALGLFMKITLADGLLAPVVRQVFDPNIHPSTLSAWIGTIAFAGQDYCDFAGYTTCATGIGYCLGFHLPENFRAPFASIGFRDLWQRWHITLVAWMRDYVFLPLGGVYKGYWRAAVNVLIVFVLIGLWHGASVTYIIFGLLHGLYLICETILQRSQLRRLSVWSSPLGKFLVWLLTMLLCCVAFVFYRSGTLQQSWSLLTAMAGGTTSDSVFELGDYDLLVTAVVLDTLIVAHWLRRNTRLEDVLARTPWWVTGICLALLLFAITVSLGTAQNFLYFNY